MNQPSMIQRPVIEAWRRAFVAVSPLSWLLSPQPLGGCRQPLRPQRSRWRQRLPHPTWLLIPALLAALAACGPAYRAPSGSLHQPLLLERLPAARLVGLA